MSDAFIQMSNGDLILDILYTCFIYYIQTCWIHQNLFFNKSMERETQSLLPSTGLVCHSICTSMLDRTTHSVCSYVHWTYELRQILIPFSLWWLKKWWFQPCFFFIYKAAEEEEADQKGSGDEILECFTQLEARQRWRKGSFKKYSRNICYRNNQNQLIVNYFTK